MFKLKDIDKNVIKEFGSVYDAHWYTIDLIGKSNYIRVFPLNGELNYSVGLNTESNTEHIVYTIKGDKPITQIPHNLFVWGGKYE